MVEIIKKRTKQIGLEIISFTGKIPNTHSGNVITRQIIRSGTSIGANYRAAIRAKSNADFIYKLKIVEEEADETIFWLELLEESNLLTSDLTQPIRKETEEILAIIVSTIKKARTSK